jgi:anti-sigma factor RsiW
MLIAASLACLLIGGGLGFQAGLWTGETPTANVAEAPGWIEQVAQYHRDVASDRDHLVQVGADKEAVEQWLTARMEHPIRVPDLSAHNLTFAGANQLLVNGRRVAQLLYLDQDGEVFGFCLAQLAPDGEAKPPTPSADGDLNMVSWREGDLGYIVVGWEPSDLLQQLAQQIKLIYSVSHHRALSEIEYPDLDCATPPSTMGRTAATAWTRSAAISTPAQGAGGI